LTGVFLRHAPESQYVFVSFAGAFLVKVRYSSLLAFQRVTFHTQLLQPKYAQYFTYNQRVEIWDLVQKAVDLLGAPDVAIDEKHGPYLYSRFLAGLLASPAVKLDSNSTPGKQSLTNPNKRSRKPKNPPAQAQGGLFADTSGSSDYSSPSCSPSPSYMFPHAENFASQDQSAAMFHGPIPMTLDAELLESAQIMTDPLWQDNLVPGTHATDVVDRGRRADCSHCRLPVDGPNAVLQYQRLLDVWAIWVYT